ncbi:C-GCAxxG-C-C family (seleno)protein [Candidatus Epulonipiscium viviparus]|uniref:C-GCAxxG-C-C family (seleno)protein n=1 Tax=Candidatus Epulonipiscium viviparus TaxID=420336 RepID=UPI0027380753|nr:C-GCAxxG-C-C family (seleno)protein [Candidatus Epulopiscium viviparus]
MTNQTIKLSQVYEAANYYYSTSDFYCAEAIIKTIRDTFEIDISDQIITLATGSSKGISHAGCTCIAISGIVMALGMVFDRTDTIDADVSYTLDLAQKLHDRFCSQHPLPCHHISIRDLDPNLNTHTQQCIHFTCEIACEITRIICRDKNISIIDNINADYFI